MSATRIGHAPAAAPMLIDGLLARHDALRIEHRVVAGGLDAVYAAVEQADFMRAWRESAAVRTLFAARSLGARAVAAAARRPHVEPPAPEAMRLADMPSHGDWVRLGESPPFEIAFGAIGRFWSGETVWEQISYDCRTLATDAAAREGFLRYWRPLSPFIGVVLRAQLGVIAADCR
jgi:hypothetical protein